MNFYQTFLKKCIEKNVSPSRAAVEAGTTKTAVSRWKAGSIPSDSTLLKLAMYFGCSVDELLGEEPVAPKQDGGTPTGISSTEQVVEPTADDMMEFLQTYRENYGFRVLFNSNKKATSDDYLLAADFIRRRRANDETD